MAVGLRKSSTPSRMDNWSWRTTFKKADVEQLRVGQILLLQTQVAARRSCWRWNQNTGEGRTAGFRQRKCSERITSDWRCSRKRNSSSETQLWTPACSWANQATAMGAIDIRNLPRSADRRIWLLSHKITICWKLRLKLSHCHSNYSGLRQNNRSVTLDVEDRDLRWAVNSQLKRNKTLSFVWITDLRTYGRTSRSRKGIVVNLSTPEQKWQHDHYSMMWTMKSTARMFFQIFRSNCLTVTFLVV
jgi:hypothetical protein